MLMSRSIPAILMPIKPHPKIAILTMLSGLSIVKYGPKLHRRKLQTKAVLTFPALTFHLAPGYLFSENLPKRCHKILFQLTDLVQSLG